MEDLFWTTLSLQGQPTEYHIVFENEEYCFIPKDSSMTSYRFKREHDEWHAVDEASERVKDSAEEALEKYLLSQH
jgi:hypothetical protein